MLEKASRREIMKENSKLAFFDFFQEFIEKTEAGGRLNSKGGVGYCEILSEIFKNIKGI